MITPEQLRVLLAVVKLHHENGSVIITDVRVEVGLSSKATVHHHLHRLRDLGFVDFEDNTQGTLHPLVDVVAHG